MTSTLFAPSPATAFGLRPSPGVSPESQRLGKLWSRRVDAEREYALAELKDMGLRVRVSDWDGYDADPVPKEAITEVARMVLALPNGFEVPTFAPRADGRIVMEWYRSPRHLINVGTRGDGIWHWSALIHGMPAYGAVTAISELPPSLISTIRSITYQ